MGSERGSAALAVIGAVGLATLVGVGVYVVIKDRRLAEDAEAQVVAARPPAVVPEAPVPVAADQPVADANAIDPEVSDAPCDEVGCVLDNYEGPCCAKYKPGAPPSSDPPESVSRQELTEALQALRTPVAACATREGFAGIIKVRFRVLPNGTVDDVRIEDVEPALATCITSTFKARTFTATTNGVTAAFPFKITGD